ncbi:MAG: putative toxin-antitoxin system toxin component, PIN family [Nitrospinae bacterium]|nr:putative toxin-antitoxin system toxin component, PIN family [Nitrospinota bacterium]
MSRKKAVLDTNVVVSALLFRGKLSRLNALWKKKAFTMAASREIIEEYVRVLAYPKFKLTEKEIKLLVQEELLPYIEPVTVNEDTKGVSKDPDDDKFLACAKAAKADFIVSGDAHLLDLKKYKGCPILTAEKFLKKFK